MKITKGERTRELIIENSAPVFNKKGVAATSLSEIMKCTGLSKGAIYGAFKDKDEISLAVFERSSKKMKEAVVKNLDNSGAIKKILSLLDFFLKHVFNPPVPGGCPLMNSAVEADDNNPTLREIVSQELLSSVSMVEQALTEGKKTGELKASVQPKEIAFALFCSLEGALVISRVSASIEPMKNVVKFWKRSIKDLGSR